MAVINMTVLQFKPGRWEEGVASIKAGNELIRKHGGENVSAMVTMMAGPATGTVSTLWTTEDYASYGKIFNAVMNDPETQALIASSMGPDGATVSFHTYVSQTIPDV